MKILTKDKIEFEVKNTEIKPEKDKKISKKLEPCVNCGSKKN